MNSLPTGTVTFLFTDIEGSTRLAQQYRDRWERLQTRHHEILQSAMDLHQGYVFQITGDAFCAAFHTAGEALRAVVKSQMDLHAENWGETPVKVRMGIHTGKAEIQPDGQYQGYLALSRVQRLMSAGHGGQVLISAATQELLLEDLREDVSLRDLGEHRLKDLIRPEHIYQLVIPLLPIDFPPLKTLEIYRHNLPVQLTSFVGREQEMEEIKQAILTHRLVTLIGTGGTGKTRLSLQVAADLIEQFPDGVWFAELAALTNANLIPQTILSALGIPEQPALAIQQLLVDYLREKKFLLVLDNCEHLIGACATLTDTLLSNSPALKIMTTSREALGVTGEMIWHVPSLSLPNIKQLPVIEQLSQYESVQLFIERAMLVQPHFHVSNDNAPAIAQICFRLDGIPLAIELAAARVRALNVEQIAKRLDDRFRLLTGGSRTALERHQTLRATIDWSYNLLSEDEKLLLERLSVFSGGWTLEAAEQICAGENDISSYDVLDLLTHLVDKSLVILDGSRYRMLETTRQYAREKLFESGEGETLRDRHLTYFIRVVEEIEPYTKGAEQSTWLNFLDTEIDNIRLALEWSISNKKGEKSLRLSGALGWFWYIRCHFLEGTEWFRRVLELRDRASKSAQAKVLRYAGNLSWVQNDSFVSRTFLRESLDIFRELGDLKEISTGLQMLGGLEAGQGHHAEARKLLEESLGLSRTVNHKPAMARVLMTLGDYCRIEGDYAAALQLFEESLVVCKEIQDSHLMTLILQSLGDLTLAQKNFLKAREYYEEALSICLRLKNKRTTAYTLLGLADILCSEARHTQSAQLQGFAVTLLNRLGAKFNEMDLLDFNRIAETLKKKMGENSYEKEFDMGKLLQLEQAVEIALKRVV